MNEILHLKVKDGKLFDKDTGNFITNYKCAFSCWEQHKDHKKVKIPMEHVLYIAYQCECGDLIIDEEQ